MNLTSTAAAMTALILVPYANAATDVSRLQILDAQITDAKHSATVAQKAAETICYNAGYELNQRAQELPNNASEKYKKCTDATQGSNDASGFVGYLYEQRSHLTGQAMPSEYARPAIWLHR